MTLLLGTAVLLQVAISLAISTALGAAAYFILSQNSNKSSRNRLRDFTPTTLATQGAYVPMVIGRMRIGCAFVWAGDRYSLVDTSGQRSGGKGSRRKKQKDQGTVVYYEAAAHALCVGPAYRLHRIWADGKEIWTGPIDSTTSPSGTAVPILGFFGVDCFTIYWGESDQPQNAFLGNVDRIGVESKWPFWCYVVWGQSGTGHKFLGPSPRWPQMEYEIEVLPTTTELDAGYPGMTTAIEPFQDFTTHEGVLTPYAMWQVMFETYPHGLGLDHTKFSIFGSGADPCSLDTVVVTGSGYGASVNDEDGMNLLEGETSISLNYVIATEGWYEVKPSTGEGGQGPIVIFIPDEVGPTEILNVQAGLTDGVDTIDMLPVAPVSWAGGDPAPGCWTIDSTPPDTYNRTFARQFVYLTVGTWTLTVTVTATLGTLAASLGVGADLDLILDPVVDGVGSFFSLCSVAFREEQVCGVAWGAGDGLRGDAAVGQCLQDLGALLYRDHTENLLCWKSVRYEPTPQDIDVRALLGPEAEVQTIMEAPLNRVKFKFKDVTKNFRDTEIMIDDDGRAFQADNVKATDVELFTVIHEEVAAKVSERRMQEDIGGNAAFTVYMKAGARKLHPGQAVVVPGIPQVLRVSEVVPDLGTTNTKVTLILDQYGAPESTFTTEFAPTPTGDGDGDPLPNEIEDWFELPAWLVTPGVPEVALLRVRDNTTMFRQLVHFSRDGSTYEEIGTDTFVQTGGTLDAAWSADTPYEVENGPVFNALGPDTADVVQDLSTNEVAWRSGKQVAYVGGEILFVREVTALGGGQYQLVGVIRARYDTEKAAHGDGDEIYLFDSEEVQSFADSLLEPGQALHVKQQPGNSTFFTLASVPDDTKTLVGKGLVPMKPTSLRVAAPVMGSPGFVTGDHVTFRWGYRSTLVPNTGAGMFSTGSPFGHSPVEGEFEIQFLTTGDVLKATYFTTNNEYEYLNADLVTDFAGEPTAFKIRVYNVNGGLRSGYVEKTVTRV